MVALHAGAGVKRRRRSFVVEEEMLEVVLKTEAKRKSWKRPRDDGNGVIAAKCVEVAMTSAAVLWHWLFPVITFSFSITRRPLSPSSFSASKSLVYMWQ